MSNFLFYKDDRGFYFRPLILYDKTLVIIDQWGNKRLINKELWDQDIREGILKEIDVVAKKEKK
ncbi:MAG: hypothetical protein AABY22_04740 [Nanoarchaeota archaeon]